ncbi:MAG: CBS domain-containing protein [Proteobacteria bacterium]|nr:CBS domain-containing protein [Pseudomonadota bacterium]
MKIRSCMTREVTCIGPTDSLREAYDIMCDQEIRHLPVVAGNNQLVGLLSERDVLLRATFDGNVINVPEIDVALAMTTDIVTCKPSHQINDIAEIMLERRVDAIPVTDPSGEIVGIITSADFIALAAGKDHSDPSIYNPIPFHFSINRFKAESSSKANRGLRSPVYDANAQ